MDLLAELRRRLDVTPATHPDDLLEHWLDTADALITPWLAPPTTDPDPYQPLIEEATVQLAIKISDASSTGLAGLDASGEWTIPGPSATPGFVRSVFGTLGPALATGGLSL